MLRYFDNYAKSGMKIIPVYGKSKVPVGNDWNNNYDKEKSRGMIATGQYNMGLLLGDIVDVEGDTDEANDLLDRMIDGLPHPMYRSSRSVHHLFRNPGHIATTRFMDIEFRSFGVQSVLPPSVHEDGQQYQWLKGTVFPIPEMPESIVNFYLQHYRPHNKKSNGPKVKRGFLKTCCRICNRKELIHEKRLRLEVKAFAEFKLPWMCHDCREIDVRPACRRIRKEIKLPTRRQETSGRS